MPDALTVLASDHRHVLELLNELTGGAGEPGGGERERKALAEQVAIAESKHEAVEELCFWPVVRSRLDNGDELVKQALEQEQTGKQLIHDLDHVTAGDVEFMTLVRRLESAVRDHITFEEGQVWPKLRLALSDAELQDLGTRMEAAKRVAPTRPHPKTPPDPKVLGTMGPAVGVMDRARDVMVGRGSGVQGSGRWRIAALAMAIGVPSVLVVVRALLRSGRRADEEARQAGKGGASSLLRAGTSAAKTAASVAGRAVRPSDARAVGGEMLRRAGDAVTDHDDGRSGRNGAGAALRSAGEQIDVDRKDEDVSDRARNAALRGVAGRLADRLAGRLAG